MSAHVSPVIFKMFDFPKTRFPKIVFSEMVRLFLVSSKIKMVGFGSHGHVRKSPNHENNGFSGSPIMKSKSTHPSQPPLLAYTYPPPSPLGGGSISKDGEVGRGGWVEGVSASQEGKGSGGVTGVGRWEVGIPLRELKIKITFHSSKFLQLNWQIPGFPLRVL